VCALGGTRVHHKPQGVCIIRECVQRGVWFGTGRRACMYEYSDLPKVLSGMNLATLKSTQGFCQQNDASASHAFVLSVEVL